jgi:UDPglucose 6-dehydrogenase
VRTKEDACLGADVLLVTTEWPEFSLVDLSAIGKLMARRFIVDSRNIIDAKSAQRAGFEYVGVGLGRSSSQVHESASGILLNESGERL